MRNPDGRFPRNEDGNIQGTITVAQLRRSLRVFEQLEVSYAFLDMHMGDAGTSFAALLREIIPQWKRRSSQPFHRKRRSRIAGK